MKTILAVIGCLGFCLAWVSDLAALEPPSRPIRFVFDLNGVTIDRGYPANGIADFLFVLSKQSDVEILFFSTQSISSIRAQLRAVRLPDGRTAEQLGRIFDGEALGDRDAAGFVEFASHWDRTKDLRSVSAPEQLSFTILVDDSWDKVQPRQRAHHLWLSSRVVRGTRDRVAWDRMPRVSPPAEEEPWFFRALRRLLGWSNDRDWAEKGEDRPRPISPAIVERFGRLENRFNYGSFLAGVYLELREGLERRPETTPVEILQELQWGKESPSEFSELHQFAREDVKIRLTEKGDTWIRGQLAILRGQCERGFDPGHNGGPQQI